MAGAFAVLCIFGLPVVAYIVVKTLAHQERMEMIRMGYYAGVTPQPPPAAAEQRRAQQASAKLVVLPPLGTQAPGATLSPLRTVLENRREN
jgi:hypothetical protein